MRKVSVVKKENERFSKEFVSFLVSRVSFESCHYILVSIKRKNRLRQTLKKKLYTNVKELALMTNDINVIFVTRALTDQAIYWHTKELTQATDLMNVMFVTRSFPN